MHPGTAWICSFFLLLFTNDVRSQNTISDIINGRGELSIVRSRLQGTTVWEKLALSSSRVTFFAPHNYAFGNITEQLRSQLNSMNSDTSNQIFLYHTVNELIRMSNFNSSDAGWRRQTLANNGPFYIFLYKRGAEYVNGAYFIEKDIVATNGILHIISSVFVSVGPSLNTYRGNLDSYITAQSQATNSQEKTTEFRTLLNKYDLYMSKRMISAGDYGSLTDDVLKKSDAFVTAFIPSDTAIQNFRSMNPNKYNDLNTVANVLQKVVESHVIPIGAYHSNLLADLTINASVQAMQGRFRMYRYGGSLYVINNCARATVTKANTTVDNGVAYIVDSLLGYVTNDLYQQIQSDNGIPDFRGTIAAAPSSFQAQLQLPAGVDDVPEDQKLTVFAPNTNAFNGNDFSQDRNTRLLQLDMTMLQGMVQQDQMVNGSQRATLASGYVAKFYRYSDGVYVEVDYVQAKIVEADICAKNGIIHKVDRILGVPARNIFGEIAYNSQTTFLETVVINTGLKTLLQDDSRDLTMFAPIDSAFTQMQSDSPSYLIRQNESKLRNILLRHVGRGTLFLDQIVPINGETTIDTYNGELRIGNQNNEYYIIVGSQRIRVIRANMRMTNGALHIVDKVLYDPNDPRTAELISNETSTVTMSPLLLISVVATSSVANVDIVSKLNTLLMWTFTLFSVLQTV